MAALPPLSMPPMDPTNHPWPFLPSWSLCPSSQQMWTSTPQAQSQATPAGRPGRLALRESPFSLLPKTQFSELVLVLQQTIFHSLLIQPQKTARIPVITLTK